MALRTARGALPRVMLALAAVLVLVAGYLWGNLYQAARRAPASLAGIRLVPPVELPVFTTRNADGAPFTDDHLTQGFTLIAFGEAGQSSGHLAVARMLDAYNRLADRPKLRQQITLVLAGTGAPAPVAEDFVRLTPALKVVAGEGVWALREAAGAIRDTPDGPSPGPLYLVDPQGRIVAVFPTGQSAETIAADLVALAAEAERGD